MTHWVGRQSESQVHGVHSPVGFRGFLGAQGVAIAPHGQQREPEARSGEKPVSSVAPVAGSSQWT